MSRILAMLFLLWSIQLPAVDLSHASRVSILTCSPGNELYSCFGHSAIRITDSMQGFDLVFNYGTFDFNQPNFYFNFAKGHMIYMLGVDRFDDFRNQYIEEQRNIYEQKMNLSTADRAKVFAFLANNAQPENRNYRYDFLFDNCATRIRDVFEKNLSGVKFDYSTFTEKKSFRDLINDYSENKPWEQFGMGLLIGLPVDKQATPAQMCFLPDYLSRGFAHATINGSPLCNEKMVILQMTKSTEAKSLDQEITPTIVFSVLAFLICLLTIWELRSKKHIYWFDCIWFFIVGLLGIHFLVLGGFTEHTTTQWNLNLLWAWPTHLVVALMLPFMKKKKWLASYFLVSAISSLIVVFGWKLMPQHFLLANIFIAAISALRSYTIYKAARY